MDVDHLVYKTGCNPCGHGNLDHADYFLKSTLKGLLKKEENHLCSLICLNGFCNVKQKFLIL